MPEKTEAQKRAQKNYMDKFVRVEIRMTAEQREEVQAHADQQCDQYVGVHEVGNGAENGCNHGSS